MTDSSSFRRGLALFAAVATDEAIAAGGRTVTELADELAMDKGQVSRMLRVLADAGLVERDPGTRMYRPGWGLFAMAARAGDRRLLDLGDPMLSRLVDRVGERAHLSVLQGSDVITASTRSPSLAVQTAGWVGRPVPAHRTASGRSLLFDHSLEDLELVFGDVSFEPAERGSPVDVADLHRRIAAAAPRGYVIVDEEFEPGLVAVAAAVRDPSGRIIASLNVSAPRFRLIGQLDEVAMTVRSCAHDLSQQLGHHADHDEP